ncbi:nucleotidyltransferase [Streptomyces sp. NBC_00370]|uniref:nucleotidyltransferase n=1 Tax=Streptomyces sp. NBC_00370 TaxID=2975728 RepID=UPI002E26ACD8
MTDDRTSDEATRQLLTRFLDAVRPVVAPVAVWAHGSLGGGDYQPGRSDLDLIAVVGRPCTEAEEARLRELHEGLVADSPLGGKLHCGYLAAEELADPSRTHLTWAQEELMRRPVTPVTRRELRQFGVVLAGVSPAGLLPAVSDEELAAFVVGDLAGFWRPVVDRPEVWVADVWVDLGLLTLARALVTLRDGELITKRRALDVLGELGAPAEVVADIRARRYGEPGPASEEWPARRAALTLAFLGPAIDRVVADYAIPVR